MNQQIKRIKGKDLSVIDERMFRNMNKASDLEGTLSHLSQLQHFLLTQISQLQGQSGKDQSMNLISQSCETLRESAINIFKENRNTLKSNYQIMKLDIAQLRKSAKSIRDEFEQGTAKFKRFMVKMIKDQLLELKSIEKLKLSSLLEENKYLKNKNKSLERDNLKIKSQLQAVFAQMKQTKEESISLKRSNEKLTRELEGWDEAKKRHQKRQEIVSKKFEDEVTPRMPIHIELKEQRIKEIKQNSNHSLKRSENPSLPRVLKRQSMDQIDRGISQNDSTFDHLKSGSKAKQNCWSVARAKNEPHFEQNVLTHVRTSESGLPCSGLDKKEILRENYSKRKLKIFSLL